MQSFHWLEQMRKPMQYDIFTDAEGNTFRKHVVGLTMFNEDTGLVSILRVETLHRVHQSRVPRDRILRKRGKYRRPNTEIKFVVAQAEEPVSAEASQPTDDDESEEESLDFGCDSYGCQYCYPWHDSEFSEEEYYYWQETEKLYEDWVKAKEENARFEIRTYSDWARTSTIKWRVLEEEASRRTRLNLGKMQLGRNRSERVAFLGE